MARQAAKHVLALDQGTTGSTCLVIREDGAVVGRGYREITQHYPQPGWVEHDPDELFVATVAAARDALQQAGVTVDAVGITNQRETVIAWDARTSQAVGKAIVWQDRRTEARCRALAARAEWISARTGLVVDPYFSGSKLEWMLQNNPLMAQLAARGELRVGTVDSWLIWKLTNGLVHATDPTNASRTMLFDIERQRWSDELCALFGVPTSALAEVRRSSGDFGVCAPEHFGYEVPIRGVAGDQQAALYGHGCWSAGAGKNTYGTGAFLLFNAGTQRPPSGGGLLTTLACDAQGGPVYALEAAIFIAGAAIQWLRDGLGVIQTAAESEQLAQSVETNGGVYFVPAFVGLAAPHWNAAARGTIVGLTRGSTRAHLVRAALESIAYSTADVVAAARAHAGVTLHTLRVDGGATANSWLMQLQSDLLNLPIERPDMAETTALGAAGLAGLAAGVWESPDHFLAARSSRRFQPSLVRTKVEQHYLEWGRAVRAALAWANDS